MADRAAKIWKPSFQTQVFSIRLQDTGIRRGSQREKGRFTYLLAMSLES